MTRWDLCNDHLMRFNPSRFLEIGIKAGAGGRNVQADLKFGVDPCPVYSVNKGYTQVFRQTSDEFFATSPVYLNLHVVFIDGLHTYEQAMRDVLNSLRHLHASGTIIMHDCNPPDEGSQIVPRQQVHWNGDVWKVIAQFRATRPDLRVWTMDADEGLGVIQHSTWERTIPHPGEWTWEGLVKNRAEWLGLVRP